MKTLDLVVARFVALVAGVGRPGDAAGVGKAPAQPLADRPDVLADHGGGVEAEKLAELGVGGEEAALGGDEADAEVRVLEHRAQEAGGESVARRPVAIGAQEQSGARFDHRRSSIGIGSAFPTSLTRDYRWG